jgi:hypothetical protein
MNDGVGKFTMNRLPSALQIMTGDPEIDVYGRNAKGERNIDATQGKRLFD